MRKTEKAAMLLGAMAAIVPPYMQKEFGNIFGGREKPKKEVTEADTERLRLAQEKRDRKAARNLKK